MVTDKSIAIHLEDVCRGYGSSKVIENLNFLVRKGTINACIGASGCGKTTLLKIILGRLIPDSGNVLVFGRKPHSSRKTIPGSTVGYAPQENALYSDISIGETLEFFGTVHNMPKEEFNNRKDYIIKLLDLPPMNRIVGSLSGGQKRRVSLAAALLHNPKLLILDEPTVGVDPMLRARIWDHLRELAQKGVTVIITTHYIEETKMADQVFLMRNGKFLENGGPNALLRKYQCESLEDVFLKLCRADESQSLDLITNSTSPNYTPSIQNDDSTFVKYGDNDSNSNNNNEDFQEENLSENSPMLAKDLYNDDEDEEPSALSVLNTKTKHVLAIGKRKLIQIIRNKVVLFFELFSPTLQIVLYFICIGGTPKNLNFGIVNYDVGIGAPVNLFLGNDLVGYLSQTGIFSFHYYNNSNDAIQQVKEGNSWGVLEIPMNFSTTLPERYSNPTDSSLDSQSSVQLYMDLTNYQISQLVEQEIQLAFEELGQQFNISLNPVIVEPAIYGSNQAKFIWFLAPGMIALITFAHCIAMTAVSFVREKIEGSLDRTFAYNVSTGCVIIGHFIGHIALLLVQTSILLFITIVVFKVPNHGSLFWVFLMVLLNGFVGMSLGLAISGVARIEVEAVQLSLACYFPTLILSGTLWPLQGITYKWIAWLPNILPATHSASALRDIMIKGVSITFPEVYQAFLIVIAWFIGLFFLAAFALNETEKNFNIKKLFKKE